MTAPLWATVVVSVIGVAAAITVWLVSLRPRPDIARYEAGRSMQRLHFALISGGPARGLDSDLVDLVERGLVRAEGGRLTATGEADQGNPNEIQLFSTVRECGASGLDAIRAETAAWYRLSLPRLVKRGFIVSPDRVQYSPMLAWAPTLIALFLCTLRMLYTAPAPGPGLPPWGPALISIGAWLVVPLVQVLFWCLQPGYRGKDPRSRLGRDVITVVAAGIDAETSQADRVAIGGFAAMTDTAMRREIMGDAADSEWDARPWRKRVFRASVGDHPGG